MKFYFPGFPTGHRKTPHYEKSDEGVMNFGHGKELIRMNGGADFPGLIV